ncbi:sulfatase-like hydrolase/transferase [Yoonia sp.]|uniref:sulfatase-like hydrolase/transferase n=1 Tax=Yoonia sp. TaxID=2212373 RepID=UPI002FDADDC2
MMAAQAKNRTGSLAAVILAAALLYLVLAVPNHPLALAWDGLLVVPLEWPVIIIGLAVLGPKRRFTHVLKWVIVVFLTLVTVIKLVDFATFSTYNRGFNPLVDLHLIPAAWNLGSGSLGLALASLIVLALIAAIAGLVWALWWATGTFVRVALPLGARRAAAVAVIACAGLAAAEIGNAMRAWSLPFGPPGAAFTTRVAVERVDMISETYVRLRNFRIAAETDPFAQAAPLLDKVGGRDVVLIYVESYGGSSLTNPRYAPTHLASLAGIEAELDAQGLAMRSGWLEAPILGGQSWMSHATLAKGLWIPDQRTYGAALVSGRRSLFHLAQDNGFETVAVMPAITMDWPEADFMGFDRIYAAADLGYNGLPFNWVTMPDQFTLTAFDRLVRTPADGAQRQPIFAQIALISSHAPWTPVPELVAWDDIGDGTIFDAVAQSGDPPDVVWRDRDRVRDQFRQAVDYSLRTVGAYAARSTDNPPLMIVMGDHPPALFVSEDEAMTVPVHVIGPPDLVARFADWGWVAGMVPDLASPAIRMDAFRNRFLATFSDGSVSP